MSNEKKENVRHINKGIRFTVSEANHLDEEARRNGRTFSQHIRYLLVKGKGYVLQNPGRV